MQNSELHRASLKQAIKKAQDLVKRYNTNRVSLTEELARLRQEDELTRAELKLDIEIKL